MKPTTQLTEEHNVIKRMIRVLSSVSERIENGEDVEPEHLSQMIDFIRTYADKCHHAKEEDLLFPAMEEAGIPRERGPIGVMLSDHDKGRAYVRGMDEALEEYSKGTGGARKMFADNARGYMALLLAHIDKEDNVLYVMADRHISDSRQEELARDFEKVEADRFGETAHERYHSMVEQLEETYL